MKTKLKTKLKTSRAGVAAAVLFASIGLSQSAKAVAFQNLPPTPIGDQYVFKIFDYDNGTLYTPLAPGASIGYTGDPGAAVGGGVTTLNGGVALQAVGSRSIGSFGALPVDRLEDSWGIAFVTEIALASAPAVPIWSNLVDKQELTIMFTGEQDFQLTQTNATTQRTAGVNLTAQFFLDDKLGLGYTPFSQSLPNVRGAVGPGDLMFTTVTDSNVNGNLPILTIKSTSGFIHPNSAVGTGGLATEFETSFDGDPLSGAGSGVAFFDVVGPGLQNAKYDTNTFISPYANTAGTTLLAGQTAKRTDLSIQFTSTTNFSGPEWLVSSNDPLRAFAAVPEPGTALAGFACLVPMFSSLLGRRRKALEA